MIRFVLPIAQDLLSDFALYKGIYKSRKAYSTELCGVLKKGSPPNCLGDSNGNVPIGAYIVVRRVPPTVSKIKRGARRDKARKD
jgi:hypothetical protein